MKNQTMYKGFRITDVTPGSEPKFNFIIQNRINEIVNSASTLEFAKRRIDLFHAAA